MLLEEYSKLDAGKMFQHSVPGSVQQCIHVHANIFPRMHLEEFGFFVKVVSDLEAGVQHSR